MPRNINKQKIVTVVQFYELFNMYYSNSPYRFIKIRLNKVTSRIYSNTVPASQVKNTGGNAARPMFAPNRVNGITVKTAMPVIVSNATGIDARLWKKGIFGVRIMWITRVWLHIDSTNHPAWKTAIYCALTIGSASWWNSAPPVASGQIIKYNSRYVEMSKTELVGPSHNINLLIEDASHLRGFSKNSLSTLSHGIAVHERSYIRFNNSN